MILCCKGKTNSFFIDLHVFDREFICLYHFKKYKEFIPRSNVTNSVNGRIQPYTGKIRSFTTMFCRNICDRITIVYLRICIRKKTEQNGDRMQSLFTKTVYDTEIYDRNTITCKSSYFFVCGRSRPCLFDLG
jgi:hypothetical protein